MASAPPTQTIPKPASDLALELLHEEIQETKSESTPLPLHPLLGKIPSECKEVALLYFPEKESHIKVASVDQAPAVRSFSMVHVDYAEQPYRDRDGVLKKRLQAFYPEEFIGPGINLGIKVDFINKCLHQNQLVRGRFQSGALTVLLPKPNSVTASGLFDFSDEALSELIYNNWNVAQLEQWLNGEIKPQIRAELIKRIDALKKGEV
jgi:hypothetical protein